MSCWQYGDPYSGRSYGCSLYTHQDEDGKLDPSAFLGLAHTALTTLSEFVSSRPKCSFCEDETCWE
jgi:hypothetical protein